MEQKIADFVGPDVHIERADAIHPEVYTVSGFADAAHCRRAFEAVFGRLPGYAAMLVDDFALGTIAGPRPELAAELARIPTLRTPFEGIAPSLAAGAKRIPADFPDAYSDPDPALVQRIYAANASLVAQTCFSAQHTLIVACCKPWQLPLYVPIDGGNDAPQPFDHAAFLYRWDRDFGAAVVLHQGSRVIMSVERPPTAPAAVAALAAEHFVYDRDLWDWRFSAPYADECDALGRERLKWRLLLAAARLPVWWFAYD